MSRARCHRLALSLQNRIATNRNNLRTRYCYQTCITTRLVRRLFQTTTTRLDKDIQLFDSMNSEIQAIPETPGKALAWYTCGPTTCELLAPNYFTFAFFQTDSRFFCIDAPAHMGHARTYVCLDIIRRVIEANASRPPLFVMNITDIDDKILEAAKADGSSPLELARRYEDDFWRDLDALNCLRPHLITRVTERIESDIIPYIQRLVNRGIAYDTDDGVYFDIRSFNEKSGKLTKYGKLAPPAAAKGLELSGLSGDVTGSKRDNRDFVLWKKQKAHEELAWESPWGRGRPGWHIECSAMIEAVQKQFESTHKFLVHAGGIDLKFPHHTNEIAQAEAYSGKEWIPHWVHTGHLHIDGLKMSKSLKNFISIQDFLSEFDLTSPMESPGDDFRLWCLGLSGSYRSPATFSRKQLAEARAVRQKIVRFLIDGEKWISNSSISSSKVWEEAEKSIFQLSTTTRKDCLDALQSDLDGSKFLSEITHVVEVGNNYLAQTQEGPVEPIRDLLGNIRNLLSLVGFSKKTTDIGLDYDDDRDSTVVNEFAIEEFVSFRSSVRKAILNQEELLDEKDQSILKLCDQVRDSMLQHGIELLDGREINESGWRFCLPKSPNTEMKVEQVRQVDTLSVRAEDYFRVGKYEGMFTEYAEDGMPIRNADGSELSNRMSKKLKKKLAAHKKRLELLND